MKKTYIRYKNRKIYSKELSQYVNLNDLVDDIRGGYTVTVIDNVTKNDVTDAVLTQAVTQRGLTAQTAVMLLRDNLN